MSQGKFTDGTYESNKGVFYNCKVQPETAAATIGGVANAFPALVGTPAEPSAIVSGSRARIGVHARYVSFIWNAAPPTNYDPNTRGKLPIFDPDVYNGINKNQIGSYLGVAIKIKGKTAEKIV